MNTLKMRAFIFNSNSETEIGLLYSNVNGLLKYLIYNVFLFNSNSETKNSKL